MAKREKSFRAYKSVWEQKSKGVVPGWEVKGDSLHADKIIALKFADNMKADSTVRLSEGPYMVHVTQDQWSHLQNFQTRISWAK